MTGQVKRTVQQAQGAPYAKAVIANGFAFISGQVGLKAGSSDPVSPDIRIQTRQVLENLRDAATDAGTSLQSAVRVNVYLTDIADFSAMNDVYREFFAAEPPSRTTVGIHELSRPEFLVEMDMIAVIEG